jgi:hypothetical protein
VRPRSNEKGAAPARTAPHTQDPAAARLTGSRASQGTASGPALAALVGYITGGTDRAPLDRLCAAARDGRALIDGGVDRTTVVAALVVAAEVAGVPRRVAEAVVARTLRGAR